MFVIPISYSYVKHITYIFTMKHILQGFYKLLARGDAIFSKPYIIIDIVSSTNLVCYFNDLHGVCMQIRNR